MSLSILGNGGGNSPVTGTYTGDGSSVTLTFPDVPKLLLITGYYRAGGVYSFVRFLMQNDAYQSLITNTTGTNYTINTGAKTMAASMQFTNSELIKSGVTYSYTAII